MLGPVPSSSWLSPHQGLMALSPLKVTALTAVVTVAEMLLGSFSLHLPLLVSVQGWWGGRESCD